MFRNGIGKLSCHTAAVRLGPLCFCSWQGEPEELAVHRSREAAFAGRPAPRLDNQARYQRTLSCSIAV